jgi:uncharacterized protein
MIPFEQAAREFLDHRKVAVYGVSRNGDTAANFIFRKFTSEGYDAFAINPNAETVENGPAFPSMTELPDEVRVAVIATSPSATKEAVADCIKAGVHTVWFHRSIGGGSYNEDAARSASEAGIRVLAAGCPLMFLEPVDVGHKCLRWLNRKRLTVA